MDVEAQDDGIMAKIIVRIRGFCPGCFLLS